MNKENIAEIFPMSDVSKGMIYHTLKNTSSYMFHEQSLHVLPMSDFQPALFEQAMHLLVDKHENLRSIFNMFDYDQPLQIVLKKIEQDIVYIDISDKTEASQRDYIDKWLEEDRQKPFDLKEVLPLWKVRIFYLNEQLICFVWITHHSIMDGWSTASIITELNNTYLALLKNATVHLDKLKCTYKDFIVEQIQEKANAENHGYWKDKLTNYKRLDLPFRRAGGYSLYNSRFMNKRYDLGASLLSDLKAVAIKSNTTVKDLCFAAYLYTLYYFSPDRDITVGYLSNSRPSREDGDKLIGCFLNTLPFRYQFGDPATWSEYATAIHEELNINNTYGRLPFLDIVKSVEHQEEYQNPLFDVLFNFTDFYVYNNLVKQEEKLQANANTFRSLEGVQKDNILITFLFSIHNGFSCKLLFYDAVINPVEADYIMNVFTRVLHKLAYHGGEVASKQSLFTPEESKAIGSHVRKDYPLDETVIKIISDQAAKTPDRTAVSYLNTTLSFKALEEEAKGLAGYLQSQCVVPGCVVGIYMDRSIDTVVAMLAVAYAGASYLPLSLKLPQKRMSYMLNDSASSFVISDETHRGTLPDNVTYIDATQRSTWTEPHQHSEALLYTMYTSGSTGQPKGVMVMHRNIINLIYGLQDIIYKPYGEGLRLGLVSPFDFDASVQHVYGSLMLGHTLCIAPEDERASGNGLVDFYEREGVTISDGTPTHLRLIAESERSLPANLKHFLIAGEVLPKELVSRFLADHTVQITNLYGPTETCVDSTYFHIERDRIDSYDSIPIGKPLPNEQIMILSEDGQVQGIGIPGELVIAGEGVSKGYRSIPADGEARFVPSIVEAGKQMYKTGDKGLWLPDGNIAFIGRLDNQIKLRGYRIELNEIKNCIDAYANTKMSIVQLVDLEEDEKCIGAFVEQRREEELSDLVSYLQEQLPLYMLPSKIVRVKNWPLTPNGKIDNKGLLDILHHDASTLSSDPVADEPVNQVESDLLDIWKTVLNRKALGVSDDFFTVGGDSIKLIKMLYTVKNRLSVQIAVQEFYGNSNVRKLAKRVDQIKNRPELVEEGQGAMANEMENFKSDFINQL